MSSIRSELATLADSTYRDFTAPLVPTVDPHRILGVRTPALRKYARTLARKDPDKARAFISEPLPHDTYDEMNLHGMLIGLLAQTPEEAFEMLEAFLPAIDNWASCDLIRVPVLKHDLGAMLSHIEKWVSAAPEYMVRFAVIQLMTLFLDEAFHPEQLETVVRINRPEYYINMARAWYFATALAKQPQATLPLFEAKPLVLDSWTHNKALQKARESRRITPEQKAYFQSLKV